MPQWLAIANSGQFFFDFFAIFNTTEFCFQKDSNKAFLRKRCQVGTSCRTTEARFAKRVLPQTPLSNIRTPSKNCNPSTLSLPLTPHTHKHPPTETYTHTHTQRYIHTQRYLQHTNSLTHTPTLSLSHSHTIPLSLLIQLQAKTFLLVSFLKLFCCISMQKVATFEFGCPNER